MAHTGLAVRAEGLVKTFGTTRALDGVDLEIPTGTVLGLLGPMGYELLFNRRIRCVDDVERSFAIPVLIELNARPRGLVTA